MNVSRAGIVNVMGRIGEGVMVSLEMLVARNWHLGGLRTGSVKFQNGPIS